MSVVYSIVKSENKSQVTYSIKKYGGKVTVFAYIVNNTGVYWLTIY